MILKRLGIGKKSEYFLEAEPLSAEDHAKPAADPAAPKIEAKAEPAKAKAKETELTAKAAAKAPETPELTAKAAEPNQKKFKKVKTAEPEVAPKAVAPKAAAPAPAPATVNFATDYLMTANTPRRRPGPSLDMFKDMAKQVGPRK